MSIEPTSPDEISPDDLTNIVIQTLRSRVFMATAADKLKPQFMDRREEQYVRITWTVLHEFMLNYNAPPPKQTTLSELKRLLGLPEYRHLVSRKKWNQGLSDYIEYIYDPTIEIPADRYMRDLLMDFLRSRVYDKAFQDLKDQELPYDELSKQMKQMELSTTISDITTINPFDLGDDGTPVGLEEMNLTSYGLPLLDKLLGGFVTGECLGLLGLTGSGKTLLQIQIACAAARAGIPVLYCSYEQGFSGDMAERVSSYVAEFDRNRVRGKSFKDYPPDIKDAIKGAYRKMGNALQLADMTKDSMGVNGLLDIKALIEHHAGKNNKPKIVIIDWLVPFLSRANYVNSGADGDLRKAWSTKYGNMVKDFAIENDIHLILSHQLNTDVLKKSVTYKPTLQNAYDLGISFGQYMQTCLALGQLSQDKICWLNPCKTRSVNALPIIVKMEGAYSRFTTDHGFIARNSKFVSDSVAGTLLDIKGIPLREGGN